MISEDLGIKLENVTLDMLGGAKRVLIEKEIAVQFTVYTSAGGGVSYRSGTFRGPLPRR